MTMTQDEILRLGAKFALHLLYRDQHDQRTMSEATASADYGNLWELLAAGLDGPEPHPQVALGGTWPAARATPPATPLSKSTPTLKPLRSASCAVSAATMNFNH